MYFMLDNYDSFVYNLSAYFEELGQKILVKRADQITVTEVEELQPEGKKRMPVDAFLRGYPMEAGEMI